MSSLSYAFSLLYWASFPRPSLLTYPTPLTDIKAYVQFLFSRAWYVSQLSVLPSSWIYGSQRSDSLICLKQCHISNLLQWSKSSLAPLLWSNYPTSLSVSNKYFVFFLNLQRSFHKWLLVKHSMLQQSKECEEISLKHSLHILNHNFKLMTPYHSLSNKRKWTIFIHSIKTLSYSSPPYAFSQEDFGLEKDCRMKL